MKTTVQQVRALRDQYGDDYGIGGVDFGALCDALLALNEAAVQASHHGGGNIKRCWCPNGYGHNDQSNYQRDICRELRGALLPEGDGPVIAGKQPEVECSTCNGSGYVEERVTGCTCGGVDIGVGVMHEPGCGTIGNSCPDCDNGVTYTAAT